jgi:hypothetical protein
VVVAGKVRDRLKEESNHERAVPLLALMMMKGTWGKLLNVTSNC